MYQLAKCLAVCLVLLLVAVAFVAAAGTPNRLTYQGRLTDPLGVSVADGLYLIRFQIYDDPVAGNLKWSSATREINVIDGLFSYNLGDSVPIPENLFASDTALWLGVKIGTDPELTPRTKLVSNPYARHSLSSDTSGIAATVYSNAISGAHIVDGSITDDDIAAGTITGLKVMDGSITGADIADGSITGADLASNTVTGTQIQDGTITTADITNGTIVAADIANGTLTGAQIQDDAIASADIADNSITGVDIAPSAIAGIHIIDGTIDSDKITDGSLMGTDIATGTVTGANIQDGSIGSADIADGSVSNFDLSANSVSSGNIVDGSISAPDIGISSIGSQHIVNASIGVVDLSAGAIAAAGWTELVSANINSTTPVTIDSVEVIAPGAGTIIIMLSGQVFLDADAAGATSVTAYAEIGICDSPNSNGTCDGTYDAFFSQDADNATANNVTKYINLQRLVFVAGPGSRKFYINGSVSSSSYFLWTYAGPKVVALFLPAAMGVSSAPSTPGTIDLSQQK